MSAPDAHAALTSINAGLFGSTVIVSGYMAKKNAPVTWQGTTVTTTNKTGAFYFTTTVLPPTCMGTVSDGVTPLNVAIGGCRPVLTAAFPATGQTTCYGPDFSRTTIACAGTGQDGETQAGADLSYTVNADGTITDTNTGLVWEKQSADGTIHDQDNAYDSPEAVAVHIAGLNTAPCFANHCDWRLPNVRELQSIVNYQNSALPVSPAFNTGCLSGATVFTGSCTAGGEFWTSTSVADPELKRSDASVWTVEFAAYCGSVYRHSSDRSGYVRAVRGGL